jgi:glycosyltransferase involved in cell wall biosynthesis
MSKSLSIVIPAYNEEESLSNYLPKVIEHFINMGYQLILVNDGSKDKTKSILNANLTKYPSIIVIHHKVNRGYGGALKSGIALAQTDYIITIDADGQHSVADVDFLFKEIVKEDADMVVGSRLGQKSATSMRGLGKFIIRSIAKLLLPIKVHDINSGMKIYNTRIAKKYIDMCPDSMAFSDVILLLFTHYRCLILERPITINERIAGQSTIGINTAIETIHEIINIVLLFNPLKIFLPASFLIFILSSAWGLPILLSGKGLSSGTLLGIMLSVFLFFLGLVAEQISVLQKRNKKL